MIVSPKQLLLIAAQMLFYAATAQDSVRYCQSKISPWCSNCYTFVKDNKTATEGTYYKARFCDDNSRAFASGKFIETKRRYILDPSTLLSYQYGTEIDTVLFKKSIVLGNDSLDYHKTTLIRIDTVLLNKLILNRRNDKLVQIKGLFKRVAAVYTQR